MKTTFTILAILLTAGTAAFAQVEPAATGPGIALPSGNLSYTFNYSQSAAFGSYEGDYQNSTLSANLNYANGKDRRPFSLAYGGGYSWDIEGPSYQTGLFQHISISQGYVWRKLRVTASDDASYRPNAPTTGFSGEAGTGEPIGGTGPTGPNEESILTENSRVLNNNTTGNAAYQMNYATSLTAGGSFDLLRFSGDTGIDDNAYMANAGLNQRLDARNTLTASYMFSAFVYLDYDFSLMTNTAYFGFDRKWSRKITTSVSVGPQWTESLNSTTPPLSLGVAVNANATYQYKSRSANVNYTRGVSNGGGYLLGSASNSVGGSFSQEFQKNLTISMTGSYRQTNGLEDGIPGQAASPSSSQAGSQSINGEVGAMQATRRVGRYLSFFAGYTAIEQSTNGVAASTVLNGLQQVINFGIGYTPRETHLRH